MDGISAQTSDAYYASLKKFWHPVMAVSDLESQPLASAELLETPLMIVRLNGELVAMSDVCRHFQAQLSLGEIRQVAGHGECVMCPYHGWSYAADGQCVDIPQMTPGRAIPESARVERYQVQVNMAWSGYVWRKSLCMASPTFPIWIILNF